VFNQKIFILVDIGEQTHQSKRNRRKRLGKKIKNRKERASIALWSSGRTPDFDLGPVNTNFVASARDHISERKAERASGSYST